MRALRRRQYYHTFDFYFVLQLAATEISTYHKSVYWWMRIHRGLKKVCITHCERVLESVERAAGGLVVDVAQQVQGEQSVRRQLARRSCCEVWLISQPRFSALI